MKNFNNYFIDSIENGILIYNNKKENLQEKINMNLEINPFDKKAVELLKEFREEIDGIIKCACCGRQIVS